MTFDLLEKVINGDSEVCAKHAGREACSLKYALSDLKLGKRGVGVGDVELGAKRAPEQGHNGHKRREIHLEGTNGRGSMSGAKGILYVSGNEWFVWGSQGHRTQVINHAVGATFHHCTLLIRSHSLNGVRLGDVK